MVAYCSKSLIGGGGGCGIFVFSIAAMVGTVYVAVHPFHPGTNHKLSAVPASKSQQQ